MYPDPWLARLIGKTSGLRGRLDAVEQILSVIGDDGHVDPHESGEVANLLWEISDLAKDGWECASRLSAAGYLGELKPLEVGR